MREPKTYSEIRSLKDVTYLAKLAKIKEYGKAARAVTVAEQALRDARAACAAASDECDAAILEEATVALVLRSLRHRHDSGEFTGNDVDALLATGIWPEWLAEAKKLLAADEPTD